MDLSTLKFTNSHEWIRFEADGSAYIGITEYAQNQLGDLVFVNLPSVGDDITIDESFGDVESVKAVSDVISPFSGKVAAINELLLDSPQEINKTPYEAWFIQVTEITETAPLMTKDEYEACIKEA